MIIRTERGRPGNHPINLKAVKFLDRNFYAEGWYIEFRTLEKRWYFDTEAERDEVYSNILATGVFVHTDEPSPREPNDPINISLIEHLETREKIGEYQIVFFYLLKTWTFSDEATRDRVYNDLLENHTRAV